MYSVETFHLLVRLQEVCLLLRCVDDNANEYSSSYLDVCVFQVFSHELSRLKIVIFKLGIEDEEVPAFLVDSVAQLTIQILAEVLAARQTLDKTSCAFYQVINVWIE